MHVNKETLAPPEAVCSRLQVPYLLTVADQQVLLKAYQTVQHTEVAIDPQKDRGLIGIICLPIVDSATISSEIDVEYVV